MSDIAEKNRFTIQEFAKVLVYVSRFKSGWYINQNYNILNQIEKF